MSDIGTFGLDLFEHARQAGRNPVAHAPQNPCTVPATPPQEAEAIRIVLASCLGRGRAMTAPAIAQAAGLWPGARTADRGTKARRILRTWYEHMAIDGHVLIAGASGFFYSNDPGDLSHYDRTQQSRIRENAITLRRTRLQALVSAGMTHHGKGRWTKEVMPGT